MIEIIFRSHFPIFNRVDEKFGKKIVLENAFYDKSIQVWLISFTVLFDEIDLISTILNVMQKCILLKQIKFDFHLYFSEYHILFKYL